MNVQELLDNRNIFYNISGGDLVVRCFNPEHEDARPSLRIDKITGKMHCFSCGFRGDVFEHFGEKVNKVILKVQELKDKIHALLVKNPLMPRGAQPFEIEYRGISASTYATFNAFTQSTDSHFVDRVVFPITDINNDLIGFIGRYIHSDADPKYKVVPSKTKLPLYPIKVEAIQNSIIVVEGIFDMLNLYDKGLTNVVTGFGISRGQLPKMKYRRRRERKAQEVLEDFSLYKLQGITRVYIMFDGDEPGKEAAAGLKEILKNDFICDTIDIENGEDPGKFTKEKVEALKDLLYENSGSGQMSSQH
jgi:DNA primase